MSYIDKDLMVRFKLDESSGTTAADSSGNGRNGTLAAFTNTTTCWVGGKRGGGLDFGQGTDDTCTFAFTDPGDYTTMMAFVRWDSTAGEFPRIIHVGNNNVPYQLLYLDSSTLNLELGVAFDAPGVSWFKTADGTVTANGTWRHLAATYDASNVSNNPIFYIDGVVSATEVQGRSSGTRRELATDFGALGQVYNETNRGLDGVISDARVYSRILTPQEIFRIANFIEPETPTQTNISREHTINRNLQAANQQYRREGVDNEFRLDQTPFSAGIKGVPSLRGRKTAYKVEK